MIDKIDISPLYGNDPIEKQNTDKMIFSAANKIGFAKITGVKSYNFTNVKKQLLLSIFNLHENKKKKLCRWYFENSNKNVYRGWFPLQNGSPTYKEGIDIGPDIIRDVKHDPEDPLTEKTPLPEEDELPNWRSIAEEYYHAMEDMGFVIMQSMARSLNLNENYFNKYFVSGNSTLRLLHYPVRDKESFGDQERKLMVGDGYFLGKPHVDSGLLTILALDDVAGLQAQLKDGKWFEIIPENDVFVMNFGRLFQKWTDNKIKATVHRVIGYGKERYSIPFFFEPSVKSYIKPIENLNKNSFEPFYYGDWLWEVTTKFIEQSGIKHLRKN